MSEDDRDREIRELRARLDAIQGGPTPSTPNAPAPSPKKSGSIGCAVAILAILGAVTYCSKQDDTSSGTYASAIDTTPRWTPPDGYERHEASRGGEIGVQWEKPTRAECRGSGVTCFAVNVVTERSCPRNLYASITLFDATGNNIGWTNDTAQGVEAGERVRLVFDTYERGVDSARIAEISCY